MNPFVDVVHCFDEIDDFHVDVIAECRSGSSLISLFGLSPKTIDFCT